MRLREDRPGRAPPRGPAEGPYDPEVVAVAADEAEPPLWCCALCGAPIANPDDAVAVDGAHRHECVNPAGIAFRIGCFARADGCRASGAPTERHSWFPPHQWRLAWCGACGEHLGWRFEAGGVPRFFGLIRDRLVLAGGKAP